MDVLMGSCVVLVGAVALMVVCAMLWSTIRALGNGNFVQAIALIVGLVVAGYYSKQGYAKAAGYFVASDFTIDLRTPVRVAPGEWSGDLKRIATRRSALLITKQDRRVRMTTSAIELRKVRDEVDSVWLCSDHLTSDDAGALVHGIANELDVRVDTLDAWVDRARHSMDRDPQGWVIETGNRRPYMKLMIDSDGHGFWWASVLYAK